MSVSTHLPSLHHLASFVPMGDSDIMAQLEEALKNKWPSHRIKQILRGIYILEVHCHWDNQQV